MVLTGFEGVMRDVMVARRDLMKFPGEAGESEVGTSHYIKYILHNTHTLYIFIIISKYLVYFYG